jgi:hypothetical protein
VFRREAGVAPASSGCSEPYGRPPIHAEPYRRALAKAGALPFRSCRWSAILGSSSNGSKLCALATYHAACERWPGNPITLRQGARVIEDSRRLRLVR